jgi:hypothetical protein
MRLMLHIFRKDARRLWWEIAVTLSLLAVLARWDCYRADAAPGPMERVLNLLLPIGWGYLVVLLIHGEAPVGDRQFWITRPCTWPSLLGAKALFALVFIHVPSLLADCVVVAARGFHPLECLPVLLWKQVMLAAALTLPAAALAAITRNLAQFVPAAVVILAAGLLLAEAVLPMSSVEENVRRAIPLIGLAVAGVLILWLQYARRRTALSRTLAIVAVLLAAWVFAYIPREYPFAVGCALSRTELDSRRLSIRFDSENAPPYPSAQLPFPVDRVKLAIPIRVLGVDHGTRVGFDQLELEILGPRGKLWSIVKRFRGPRPHPGIRLGSLEDQSRGWQVVMLDRSFYDRIKGTRVTVVGKLAAYLFREREAGRLAALGTVGLVPGLGRCSSVLFADEYGREMVKVVCESPFALPLFTRVRLLHQRSEKVWNQQLGSSWTSVRHPTVTWLSPLNRSQTFFHVAEEAWGKVSRLVVPRDLLSQVEIELVAGERTGCAILRYEMEGLNLQEFEVERPHR